MTLAPSTPIPPPNPLALHWLLPALEAQFARLSPALVRYVGSGDPETHDEVCHALAQCAGVFRLLHQDAQARLCQDITRLLEKALSSPSTVTPSPLDSLQTGLNALQDTLSALAAGVTPAEPPRLILDEIEPGVVKTCRSRYQKALLFFLKNPAEAATIRHDLRDALTPLTVESPFWTHCQQFIDRLEQPALAQDPRARQLCSHIDAQLRRRQTGEAPESERLWPALQDFLPDLAPCPPTASTLISAPSLATARLQTGRRALAALSAYPHGERNARSRLLDALTALGMQMAQQSGEPQPGGSHTDEKRLIQALQAIARWLPVDPAQCPEEASIDIASALHALVYPPRTTAMAAFPHQVDALVARLHALMAGLPPRSEDVALLDSLRQPLLRQARIDETVQHMRNALSAAEIALAALPDPATSPDLLLEPLITPLRQLASDLTLLGHGQALSDLTPLRQTLARHQHTGTLPDETFCQALADSLAHLDFFTAALPYGIHDYPEFLTTLPGTTTRPAPSPELQVASDALSDLLDPALAPVVLPASGQSTVETPAAAESPLRQLFLREAQQHLDTLDKGLAVLCETPALPVAFDLSRAAHTLASTAATVGFPVLHRLARALENALSRREGSPDASDPAALLSLQQAVQSLRTHSQACTPQAQESATDAPLRQTLDSLYAPARPLDDPSSTAAPDQEMPDDSAAPPLAAGDSPLLPVFLAEAEEQLPQLRQHLEDWQKHPGTATAAGAAMARLLHTFKGNARMAGAQALGNAAHDIESRLDPLRRQAALTTDDFAPLGEALDALATATEALRQQTSAAPLSPRMRRLPAAEFEALEARANCLIVASHTLDNTRQALHQALADMATELSPALSEALLALDRALTDQSAASQAFRQCLVDLHQQPFSNLNERLQRVARQTARFLGKSAALRLLGSDVQVDRARLDALAAPLEHLIRNAIIHGIEPAEVRTAAGKPASGQITVGLEALPGALRLWVSDDGRGLDTAAIARKAIQLGLLPAAATPTLPDLNALKPCIFEPGLSTASEISLDAGRGIGLDVVRMQVQALAGQIDVDSTAGQGTTFTLYLPLSTADHTGPAPVASTSTAPVTTPEVAPTAPSESQPSRGLVMVIDDSLTVRNHTQRLLEREGYTVELAKDGVSALDRLTRLTPDIILCDLEMPHMDGYDLIRALRASSRLAKVPIIVITSRTGDKASAHALALGANHYLVKPFSDSALLAQIADYKIGTP